LIVEETKNKTAVFSGLAKGSVLEANKIKNNFNSITIIVEEGTFKVGSVVVIKG
jgi:translation initiation factor IF-2